MEESTELKLAMEQGIGWCLIPPFIMCRDDLSHSQKILYGRIQGLVNNLGYCFATNHWLGNQACLKKETVSSLLSDLQNKQLLQIDVIRDERNRVVERRIFLMPQIHPPGNPGGGLKKDTSPKKIGDSPKKIGYPLPKKIGEGDGQQTLARKGFEGDFSEGSVDNISVDISNNKNSFTESNLSHNGENPSHTVKPRSTPIPDNTIPIPSDEPAVPTAKEVGREIMKHKGEGLWKLLKVVRKVERMPSGSTYWFQQCTIVGQMVTIQGIELNRILEVISWLFAHHNDEFVPKFYDAMEFRNKFFKLETAMLKAKQPNRNRGHRHEFLSSSGEDKFMVGPNGSMAHFPMHKERKGIYADPNQILVRV